MRQKLVVGNWKMNASRAQLPLLLPPLCQAKDLACQLVLCPPFPYLPAVAEYLIDTPLLLGAQNVAASLEGAFTGEVSASMLADWGVRYVLVGHSERRLYQQEEDSLLLAKMQRLLEQGLHPLVCVGETQAQRAAGQTEAVISQQLDALLPHLKETFWSLDALVLAYEPVWAIGTGLTATPEQAQAVHHHIRSYLRQIMPQAAEHIPLLYGGSLKPENAASLFAMPDIDGGLVGGASLDAEQFLAIARAASESSCRV